MAKFSEEISGVVTFDLIIKFADNHAETIIISYIPEYVFIPIEQTSLF